MSQRSNGQSLPITRGESSRLDVTGGARVPAAGILSYPILCLCGFVVAIALLPPPELMVWSQQDGRVVAETRVS